MSVTGFLSVWISNTATTSMILPIVISIVKQIVRIDPRFKKDPKKIEIYELETISGTQLKNTETESENELEVATDAHHAEELTDEILFESNEAKKMLKGFCLSITYAATIGGTASLIGTSSNVVFKNHFDKFHPNDSMNFLTFMLYSFPISLVLTLLCWVVLCFVWLPKEYGFVC
jgi:di/tricarboxylate transporter